MRVGSGSLLHEPLVDPTAEVTDCILGRFTGVGARTRMLDVKLSDYSYLADV